MREQNVVRDDIGEKCHLRFELSIMYSMRTSRSCGL